MNVTLSVLVDNTESNGFGAEWGYSLAIENRNGNLWIWDAGQSDLFVKNAAKLDIDLSMAKGMVLSHGHYDHGGGISALLAAGFAGTFYAHPGVERKRFAIHDGKVESIGLPQPMPEFDAVNDYRELDQGLEMITDIPRRPGLYQAVKDFYFDEQGTEPDPVEDDTFLLLDTPHGPVVLLGCCHSGLENTLFQMRDVTGLERLHAVIGGMHLYNATDREIEDSVRVLKRFGVDMVAPAHCTGADAAQKLAEMLPCEVMPLTSGMQLDLS